MAWTTLTDLIERLTHPGTRVREKELRLAAAALLIHALAIDGEVTNEERRKLNALLQTHFGVDDDEARRLIREAIVPATAASIFTGSPASCAPDSIRMAASRSSRCCGKSPWSTSWCTSWRFEPRLAGG